MHPPSKAAKCKDHGIDLMRVRIYTRLPLGSRIAFPIIWMADPDEVLGNNPFIECVECHGHR